MNSSSAGFAIRRRRARRDDETGDRQRFRRQRVPGVLDADAGRGLGDVVGCAFDGEAIEDLLSTARPLLMEPVVEVSNEAELREVLATSAKIIAITNRDPETYRVDRAVFHKLAPMIDAARVVIAAGGFDSRAEVDRLAGLADRGDRRSGVACCRARVLRRALSRTWSKMRAVGLERFRL